MKLERIVLRSGGAAMIIGAASGIAGLVTGRPGLKSVAAYCLGFGVIIACVPLLLLAAVSVFGKKGG